MKPDLKANFAAFQGFPGESRAARRRYGFAVRATATGGVGLLAFTAALGCDSSGSTSAPPVRSGTVVSMIDVPSTTSYIYENVPTGVDCIDTKYGDDCTTTYTSILVPIFSPEKYKLTLRQCKTTNGLQSCRVGVVDVSQQQFKSTEIGQKYPAAK